jgi:hypothetical protein
MICFSRHAGIVLACSLSSASLAGTPFLEAATYAGSTANEIAYAMDIAPDGSIYIVGYTDSPSLPNALNAKSGFIDIFVMKLSADMTTLHWSRYVGGEGALDDLEFAYDCAATADSGVVVTGMVETPDFPTVNALDSTLGGNSDAVLFKLDADGNVAFSTYIGGSGNENVEGAGLGKTIGEVEVAADGSIFLAGNTRSSDFPLVDPIDSTFGGFQPDGFVMKITGDGQTILASTYLGDEFADDIRGMRLDSADRPVIVGNSGPGWPYTPGAYSFGQQTSSGLVFVTKLAADGQSIAWSARIERVDDSGGHLDFYELDIAPDDTVTVVGEANGGGFPVPANAYQPDITPGSPTRDAIAFSFSSDGAQLTAGTFLGATNIGEESVAVGVDSFGQILLAVNIDTSPPNPARVYKLNAEMTMLLESPILVAFPGATRVLRVDEQNDFTALIAGSGDTTPGAFQESPPGGNTPYIARWNMQDPPDGAAPGDLNNDGFVDSEDRALFCAAIGSMKGDRNFLAAADLNGDDVIDQIDLQLLNELMPPCAGDVVSSATFQPPPDGVTDAADLAYVLGAWGDAPSCADFVSSRTFAPPPDGMVNAADLAYLLGSWGSCD